MTKEQEEMFESREGEAAVKDGGRRVTVGERAGGRRGPVGERAGRGIRGGRTRGRRGGRTGGRRRAVGG